MKAPKVIGFVLLFIGGSVTPGAANWFSNPYLGINRNIGSAPNPTPEQIRQERLGEHQLFSSGNDVDRPDDSSSARSSEVGSNADTSTQPETDPAPGTTTQTGKPIEQSPGSF